MPISAVTLDFWDTLYDSTSAPERKAFRRAALRRLFAALGSSLTDDQLAEVIAASAAEADRWWREEHRGYSPADRIRWMLGRFGIERPPDCEHVARACDAVDDALLRHPAALLPGAAAAVRAIAERYPLAIISDTGFSSGRAQDCLLERDGLLSLFPVRIYSMDIGHAKPRREPFAAALRALGLQPEEVIHIGDIERTDVQGALAAGMRAVRLDIVRRQGASVAELVARSFDEVVEYLTAD
jgi:FMN phosphatase YigB (HAD superfamily)